MAQERRRGWLARLESCCGLSNEDDYGTSESEEEGGIIIVTSDDPFAESLRPAPANQGSLEAESPNNDLFDPDSADRVFPSPKLAIENNFTTVDLDILVEESDWDTPRSSTTDETIVFSPVMDGMRNDHFQKTPAATPVHTPDRHTRRTPERRDSTPSERQLRRDSGDVHPTHADDSNGRRWTDDMLEGFLYSTLVYGGLVLKKLDSKGKRKVIGERIMYYEPKTMELKWNSTGIRNISGGMMAKAIDDVLRDGSVVTIVYSATAADGGPKKKGIMSPLRTPRAASQQKVFEAGQDRDAQILQEILLLVQRKAKAAAAGDAEFPCPKLMDMRAKLEERRNRLQRASPV